MLERFAQVSEKVGLASNCDVGESWQRALRSMTRFVADLEKRKTTKVFLEKYHALVNKILDNPNYANLMSAFYINFLGNTKTNPMLTALFREYIHSKISFCIIKA